MSNLQPNYAQVFLEVALRHLTARPLGVLTGSETTQKIVCPNWLNEVSTIAKALISGAENFHKSLVEHDTSTPKE